MSTQYVRVQFNPLDRRSYTYKNEGHELEVEDHVVVETARGETEVTVIGICDEAPEFECKPILRKVEPAQDEGESA